MTAYAELHCHTNFSFLDGASAPDELAERAAELGLSGLAVTDHQGLYGVVRGQTAYEAAGLAPVLGIEVELPGHNGAERAREAFRGGATLAEIQRQAVAETRRTYGGVEQPA